MGNEITRAYDRGVQAGLRRAILYALGDKCVKCGITDIEVLEIDHKQGGGTKERKSGAHYIRSLCRKLCCGMLQLLCGNCHRKITERRRRNK